MNQKRFAAVLALLLILILTACGATSDTPPVIEKLSNELENGNLYDEADSSHESNNGTP